MKKLKRNARYDAYADIRRAEREDRYRQAGRIRLAGQGAQAKGDGRIYGGEARSSLVSRVIDEMRDWRSTPFEHEGHMTAALRSALCLERHGWQRADIEAISLVGEALVLMGAERPSWAEAQWSYTDSSDRCSWCHGPIDDEDRSRSQRFCSVMCARSALEHRVYETRSSADAIAQSAHVLIARKQRPSVQCRTCGKDFHPRDKKAVYCSPKCIRTARGGLLADRKCPGCGKIFHPADHNQRHCSHSCAGRLAIATRAERLPERHCTLCLSIFRPKAPWAMYCSPRCQADVRNAAARVQRQRATADKRAMVLSCDWCGKPVLDRGDRARTCSRNCSAYLANAKAGKLPKRITPPVFDFVFQIAA